MIYLLHSTAFPRRFSVTMVVITLFALLPVASSQAQFDGLQPSDGAAAQLVHQGDDWAPAASVSFKARIPDVDLQAAELAIAPADAPLTAAGRVDRRATGAITVAEMDITGDLVESSDAFELDPGVYRWQITAHGCAEDLPSCEQVSEIRVLTVVAARGSSTAATSATSGRQPSDRAGVPTASLACRGMQSRDLKLTRVKVTGFSCKMARPVLKAWAKRGSCRRSCRLVVHAVNGPRIRAVCAIRAGKVTCALRTGGRRGTLTFSAGKAART